MRISPPIYTKSPPQRTVEINNTSTADGWLMDSGASHHVTSDLQNLAIHNPYTGNDSIVIGNGSGLPITQRRSEGISCFRFQRDVPFYSMTSPSFVHDFAITKRPAIFAEIQIVMRMNVMDIVFKGGSLVRVDNRKTPRLGVIPRDPGDDSEMKWFEVPGFNIIHTINAWDEDDGNTVILIAPNIMSIQHALERMDLVHALVEKVKIDLVTRIVTRHPMSTSNLDFAVINPAFLGRRNRYVYAAIGYPMPKISGVVKLDVSKGDRDDCTVARRMYGPGCYGGEPFFVARDPDDPEAEEDDGFVVTFVHDEEAGESKFLVMDAKSPELEIVAALRLPRRVPYGFHGLFVTESELNKMKCFITFRTNGKKTQ